MTKLSHQTFLTSRSSSTDKNSFRSIGITGGWSKHLSFESFAWTDHIFHRPDVKIFCDIDYDPFLLMEDQQKVYGEIFSMHS